MNQIIRCLEMVMNTNGQYQLLEYEQNGNDLKSTKYGYPLSSIRTDLLEKVIESFHSNDSKFQIKKAELLNDSINKRYVYRLQFQNNDLFQTFLSYELDIYIKHQFFSLRQSDENLGLFLGTLQNVLTEYKKFLTLEDVKQTEEAIQKDEGARALLHERRKKTIEKAKREKEVQAKFRKKAIQNLKVFAGVACLIGGIVLVGNQFCSKTAIIHRTGDNILMNEGFLKTDDGRTFSPNMTVEEIQQVIDEKDLPPEEIAKYIKKSCEKEEISVDFVSQQIKQDFPEIAGQMNEPIESNVKH